LIQAYTLKGEILEKDRFFNVAYTHYKQARDISVNVFGPDNQNSIELSISLNRAIFRCKREPRFNFSEKDLGESASVKRNISPSLSNSPIT
jgi:hypothetical protein